MQTLSSGVRSLSFLIGLNVDRLIYATLILGALFLGAALGGI